MMNSFMMKKKMNWVNWVSKLKNLRKKNLLFKKKIKFMQSLIISNLIKYLQINWTKSFIKINNQIIIMIIKSLRRLRI
jgi:hypothetical protein